MSRLLTALTAGLAAGWLVAGSATGASANSRHCSACGPLPPTVHVHTVHPLRSVTRYHDLSVYRHVARDHRIVNITRVQPIVQIHDVTRVHHHTLFYVKDSYVSRTVHVRPLTYVHSSIEHLFDRGCGCGS